MSNYVTSDRDLQVDASVPTTITTPMPPPPPPGNLGGLEGPHGLKKYVVICTALEFLVRACLLHEDTRKVLALLTLLTIALIELVVCLTNFRTLGHTNFPHVRMSAAMLQGCPP